MSTIHKYCQVCDATHDVRECCPNGWLRGIWFDWYFPPQALVGMLIRK